ncbi:MAG: hypothetical protein QNK05_02900 [Myxococcota bacterium]|nr:hypothetical protein [Myxococcota bacterium]
MQDSMSGVSRALRSTFLLAYAIGLYVLIALSPLAHDPYAPSSVGTVVRLVNPHFLLLIAAGGPLIVATVWARRRHELSSFALGLGVLALEASAVALVLVLLHIFVFDFLFLPNPCPAAAAPGDEVRLALSCPQTGSPASPLFGIALGGLIAMSARLVRRFSVAPSGASLRAT